MAVKNKLNIPQVLRRIFNLKKVETIKNPDKVESGADIVTNKQIKYGTKSQAIWGIFAEYCDSSTIHGIKYLGEQKRPLPERLFWIFVFLLSIYSCAMSSVNIWNKWHNNPVIVSFAEKTTPVWEIPFPAVTICTERKYNKKDFFLKKMKEKFYRNKTTTKETIKLTTIGQVCDNFEFIGVRNSGELFANASDLIEAMEKYELCKSVIWSPDEDTFCDAFRKILTEEGVCYSFNNFDLKEIYREEALIEGFYYFNNKLNETYPYNDTIEWNLEDGYSPDAGSNTFPRRVLRNSAKDRLFLGVEDWYQKHMRCGDRVPGFKIVLHTPGEIARVSEQYIPIPFKQTVRISINPVIVKTSEGLKDYDPMRRLCYFQHERYLRYFKLYTQSNCRLECLSNFTLNRCGCVRFSMPRTNSTRVCGVGNIGCMDLAESELVLKEFNMKLNKPIQGLSNATSCNCLPDCTSISYKAEVSQGVTEYTTPKINNVEDAEVLIFFKEEQFLTLQRSELYGTTDFLASCGGLLGLFMGVSTLSIAELVYFCFVRVVTNLIMRKKKRLEMDRRRHREMIAAIEVIVA